MTQQQLSNQTISVALLYDGWQIWDGHYGAVRVGDNFSTTIEFVPLSPPRPVAPDVPLGLAWQSANRYSVAARVVDVDDAVVLDLGPFRTIRRVDAHARLDPLARSPLEEGQTIAIDLSLNLNAWPDAPWTLRAIDLHHAQNAWHVDRIDRFTSGSQNPSEVDRAATDTVDSANQYCLLQCTLTD